MPRTTRDRIKDKRKAVMHAIERIEEHLFGIDQLSSENPEVAEQVIPPALQVTEQFKEVMADLLRNL